MALQLKKFLASGVCVAIFLLVFSIQPAGGHAGLPSFITRQLDQPDPIVMEMIDQVDQAQVSQLTGNLSGAWPVMISGAPYTITSRHSLSGEPIQMAAQYLFEYYQDLGLAVTMQDFTYSDSTLYNVVAELKGSVFPERVFLITSHYDDMPALNLAPGADDNASGTVGVMLAAKILSQYDFGCTLRFINFSGEEQGLRGSSAYTHQAYCEQQDQRGVLNLDMIAWNTPQSRPEVDLHASPDVPGSTEIASLFTQVVDTYGLNLIPALPSPPTYASDHARFWAFDVPAILVIEDFSDFNPNYHSQNDTLQNVPDLAYYTEMIKASLGTLAHMGCLVEDGWGSLSGIVSDRETSHPIEGAQVFLFNPTWGYTFRAITAEDGSFAIPAPAGEHQVSADARQFSASLPLTVTLLPGETSNQNLSLTPAQERSSFLPFAGENAFAPLPGCP